MLLTPTDTDGPHQGLRLVSKIEICAFPQLILVHGGMVRWPLCEGALPTLHRKTAAQMKAKREVKETHHTSRSGFGKHKARMLFLFRDWVVWHVAKYKGLACSQQQRENWSSPEVKPVISSQPGRTAPECQEQAWKGGGLSSIKELSSPWQPCGGEQRAVRAPCGIGMLPKFFKGQQGAAVPPHTQQPQSPILLHRQWVCSPKNQNSFDLQFFSLLFSLNYT